MERRFISSGRIVPTVEMMVLMSDVFEVKLVVRLCNCSEKIFILGFPFAIVRCAQVVFGTVRLWVGRSMELACSAECCLISVVG